MKNYEITYDIVHTYTKKYLADSPEQAKELWHADNRPDFGLSTIKDIQFTSVDDGTEVRWPTGFFTTGKKTA